MRRDHRLAAATGGAGTLLVAVGGATGRAGLLCAYAGLALLLLGWWRYGQCGPVPARQRWATLGLWAAPLLLAPPLFSRDAYSYLAQGLMAAAGLDVYRWGPAALGGPVAERVPELWQHTPSPYGPVWLAVSRAVTAVTGDHPVAGVIGMRLVALGGVALLAASVPALARACGVPVDQAWWLAVLNPLVLLHLVGGAHNDALMAGLLAAGLVAAVRDRPLLGAALVTLAALVKVPAILGLAAIVLLTVRARQRRAGPAWERRPGPARERRPGPAREWVAVPAIAVGVTVAVGELTGYGYGWLSTLSTPVSPGNWSLTGGLGRLTADLFAHDGDGIEFAGQLWRGAGMLAVVVVVALVLAHRERCGPIAGLGLVLLALAVFGPALRPWYLLWALVPLAVALPAVHRPLALLSAGLALVVLPDGYAADLTELSLATLGVLVGVAAAAPFFIRVPENRVPDSRVLR